jgi:hypothetical protein
MPLFAQPILEGVSQCTRRRGAGTDSALGIV